MASAVIAAVTSTPANTVIAQTFSDLIFFIIKAVMPPVIRPIKTGKITISIIRYFGTEPPEVIGRMKLITSKNTQIANTSSITAKGISVLVTGPSVLYSDTMDNAGAGAVAKAIPPKIKPRKTGISIK